MVVQHNMQAMNANRMLNVTTSSQSKSTEKLSSGYKINRAADDAAGLSISEKMRKQIKGLDRASTNAEDGVSAVQTAEGALTEVHSMVQRMNELAVQAANGTNSESDRQAIQDEIGQLTTEIDRVSETTKFNETYLLKGTYGTHVEYLNGHDAGITGTFVDSATTASLAVDLSVGTSITIGGTEYHITDGETYQQDAKARVALDAASKDGVTKMQSLIKDKAGTVNWAVGDIINLNGTVYTMSTQYNADGSTELVAGAGTGTVYSLNELAAKVTDGVSVTCAKLGADYKDNNGDGVAIRVRDYSNTNNISAQEAGNLIKAALEQANNIGATDGQYSSVDSKDETITNPTTGEEKLVTTFNISKGKANVQNSLAFDLHVGADADMSNKITITIDSMSSAGLGLSGLNVADDTGMAATYAIDAIADALQKVSDQRSELGAIQNRLEYTIRNLDNVVENTTAAESRIRDTDMAEEMVEYSKNNILAQAGQSMLAQANQATQGVLSLLQ